MSPLHADFIAENKSQASLQTDAVGTVSDGQRLRTAATSVINSTWMCLVLSPDIERRRRLLGITGDAGWRPIECESVGDAMKQSERWKTHLAIVDFYGLHERQRQTFRKFAEWLGKKSEPLLMICDDEDSSSTSEVWARQVGVWLYLPEASLGNDLVDLCAEAIQAAEKQAVAKAVLEVETTFTKQR